MKRIEEVSTIGRRPLLLGLVCGAISLAGCDSGGTDTSKPAPAPSISPASSPRTKADVAKATKDTTSRRDHQKEQAGKVQ